MKHILLISGLVMLVMTSCKKEFSSNKESSDYLKNVQNSIRDSMNVSDFQAMDFTKAAKTLVENNKIILLRIPFKGKSIINDFVLLQTDNNGKCLRGRIVKMEGGISEDRKFNGSIRITSLQRNELVQSNIKNGFIEAFVPEKSRVDIQTRTESLVPDPYETLPAVIVVGYYPSSGGGISWSTWISLLSFFDNVSGSGGGFYGSGDPFGGGGGYGGGGGTAGGGSGGGSGGGGGNQNPITEEAIYIDFEGQYSDPAIEIQKYVNCFNAIPDAGATCKMTIFTDIPVNGDPTKLFDWNNGSPGHTFIQFQKRNGSQITTQNIGFYPVTGWKTTLTPAPIQGKFVDNHHHEFNASYEMNITAAQLQTGLIHMLYLERFVQYDIDDYNCTDWALNVFNEVASPQDRLDIPRYDIPGGMAPAGTSTPQGLFIKLTEMKNAGGPQAAGIVIPLIGWVGASSGPCN